MVFIKKFIEYSVKIEVDSIVKIWLRATEIKVTGTLGSKMKSFNV